MSDHDNDQDHEIKMGDSTTVAPVDAPADTSPPNSAPVDSTPTNPVTNSDGGSVTTNVGDSVSYSADAATVAAASVVSISGKNRSAMPVTLLSTTTFDSVQLMPNAKFTVQPHFMPDDGHPDLDTHFYNDGTQAVAMSVGENLSMVKRRMAASNKKGA